MVLAIKIRDILVYLEKEENAAGFIGVNLEHDEETGLLEMKQTGLIDCVSTPIGLDKSMAKENYTPTGSVHLVNNEDGVPVSGIFNYNSSV